MSDKCERCGKQATSGNVAHTCSPNREWLSKENTALKLDLEQANKQIKDLEGFMIKVAERVKCLPDFTMPSTGNQNIYDAIDKIKGRLERRSDSLFKVDAELLQANKDKRELAEALKKCAITLEEVDGSDNDTEELIKLANKFLIEVTAADRPQGVQSMKSTQDPKYGINDEGVICNIATGVPIPDDEPVFILRAKDITAEQTLAYYLTMTATERHKDAIKHRLDDFRDFRLKNPDRMKAPDTVYPFPENN